MRTIIALTLLALVLMPAASARGQFGGTVQDNGPKLAKPVTQRIKVGITVKAVGGPCQGIFGTAPVPTEWPEQQVKVVAEDVSPTVKKIEYRDISGTVKQMMISIPNLPSGQEARALVTFEITRSTQSPPDDTSIYSIPKKVGRELNPFVGASPFIESRHPKIKSLAKQAGADKEGWAKVEALYDAARDKVKFVRGPLKGALRSFNDGEGDVEDITCLFIALCRATGVPARTVWVDDSCYPEFYLVDQQGMGYWFPCQAAGAREFGGTANHSAILQKGDNFRDPDRPKDKLRFVNEYLKGAAVRGGGQPKVKFIREPVAE